MTESQSITDRLSNLPSSIIHIILSSLPTKDAVRTSVLSRQWKYTWTGVHKLVFELDRGTDVKSQELLTDFVTHALSAHQGSLDKFTLHTILDKSCADMGEWLLRLSTKDLSKLSLYVYPSLGGNFEWLPRVHKFLYSCNKLTHLCLRRWEWNPPPPMFKGFSFLRRLTLTTVKISSTTFESLVSNSPLLEVLEWCQVMTGQNEHMVRIRAPNLKYLYLLGHWTEMYLDAPLIAKIRVELYNNVEKRGQFYNYGNFLGGCTNLEKLTGYGAFTQVMCIPKEFLYPNSLVFRRLATLSLYWVDFGSKRQLRFFARLLIDSPNLQKLEIMIYCSRIDGDARLSSFGFEPNFRMEKLRAVEMTGVRCIPINIAFIKFLIERSPLLETMSVGYPEQIKAREIEDLTNKILRCTPCSQSAEILISMRRF